MTEPEDRVWEPGPGPHIDSGVAEVIWDELEDETRLCRDMERAMVDACAPWSGRAPAMSKPGEITADEIVLLEFGRSTQSFRAALDLVAMGFAPQASMLNRAMFEGMAVAHWVHANPEMASDRFVKAAKLDSHLKALLMKDIGWTKGDEWDHFILGKEELGELQALFGDYGHKLWTEPSDLRKLVESVKDQWTTEEGKHDLDSFTRVANRQNNQVLHATVNSITDFAIDFERTDVLTVANGPRPKGARRALYASSWNYFQVLTLISDRFELAEQDRLQDLLRRASFVWPAVYEDQRVGRNEPCPCGNGKKFKRCHEDKVRQRNRATD